MKSVDEIRRAFHSRVDEEIEIRLAEEHDRKPYEALLAEMGVEEIEMQKQIASELVDNIDHICKQDSGFDFAVFYRGNLAGNLRFKGIEWNWENKNLELGYALLERYRGKGIITRACREAISLVYRELDIDKIKAHGRVDNPKSEAVAKRLGFQKEGISRHHIWVDDRPVDYWLYGMLRDEWSAIENGTNDS